jgi:hypothetical protein
MHQVTLSAIVAKYPGYDTMEAFGEGFVAHQHRNLNNPYEGVRAQAWDRGAEAAMKYEQAESLVGWN